MVQGFNPHRFAIHMGHIEWENAAVGSAVGFHMILRIPLTKREISNTQLSVALIAHRHMALPEAFVLAVAP
jgi:hypothetical protein